MVSDHSENVEFYRYRQSDGSAIAKIEPLAEVGGAMGPILLGPIWPTLQALEISNHFVGAFKNGSIFVF